MSHNPAPETDGDFLCQSFAVCHRSYPAACHCRKYGQRAINPCDSVDRQLVYLSPERHRASVRVIQTGLYREIGTSGDPVPVYADFPRTLSHEEKQTIAKLTGTHYGPVALAYDIDEETGEVTEYPDQSLPGYRYRHPYITREASGAVPIPDTQPFM